MTLAHLVFALGTTIYILVAIQLEERDLLEFHGQAYGDYRDRVPMLIPWKRDCDCEASPLDSASRSARKRCGGSPR